jgi:HD-GYP domain-containing protein (c-di-GMP phosphodiesterase class II)
MSYLAFKTYERYKLKTLLAIGLTHIISLFGYFFLEYPEHPTIFNLSLYVVMMGLIMLRYLGFFSLLGSFEELEKSKAIYAYHQALAEIANLKLKSSENQFLATLNALAKARDHETGNHIIRTQNYVKIIALRLRSEGFYVDELSDQDIEDLYLVAPLHDLGKIGIPDNILLKEGALNEQEWNIMKTHAIIGENVLGTTSSNHLVTSNLVTKGMKIAGGHHERWDGSGYPRGLVGDEIPLEARIMTLADVYDALRSDRSYKKAWSHEQAFQHILLNIRVHFDPKIIDAFILEKNSFEQVSNQFKD